MNDSDRLLSFGERVLEDGCSACNFSKVYCRCISYIEGGDSKCCGSCDHEGAK